jgi:hypothetical protein
MALGMAVLLTIGVTYVAAAPAGAASGEVLILVTTVTGGENSVEASEVAAQGLTPVVVDAATWQSMTTAQFSNYRAIILGDATCGGDPSAAIANHDTWGAAITGNIIINGTDPVFHDGQGGNALTRHSVDFAIAQTNKTGLYASLSCYFHDTDPHTPVPMLDGLRPGGFSMTGVGCYNDAHIVATHPALAELTDTELSNWSCSVHEAFDAWPPDFTVLAIAKDFGAAYTASDGTVGTPYILARGAGLRSFPLSLDPTSQNVTIGATARVTAQLLDGATSAPVAGSVLRFRLASGPNVSISGSCTPASCATDTAGHVSWSYVGKSAGTDTVQTWMDSNGDGAPSPGEPQTTGAINWTVTSPACSKDVLFIGARGSGENPFSAHQGLGVPIETTWTLVHNRLGDRVDMLALPYEALPVDSLANMSKKDERDLFQSVEMGQVILGGTIRNRLNAWEAAGCTAPLKVLLAGYSQGAWVVGDTINFLGDDLRAHIAGVALLGDPEFNHTSSVTRSVQTLDGIAGPRSPYVPGDMTNRVRSLCHDGDGVCNANRSNVIDLRKCLKKGATGVTCRHFGYVDPGPEAQIAGNYLANLITG